VIVAESSRSRRLVGRLDSGADLLSQLADLCRDHRVRAGEARVSGTVEDATVGERRLAGRAEIVSFAAVVGNGVRATATLFHDGGLVGGRLAAARVVACDVVVDAYDDVAVAEPPTPSFEAPAKTSWSDVVAASAASERRHEPAPPPVRPAANLPAEDEAPAEAMHVRPGDLIDHPKFGRCAVERVDGDMEFVTARLRNQRLIRLSLEVLTLIPAGQADGKNLFRAVAGK
jgi:predicted DNA-binding protein with PD1-like motif